MRALCLWDYRENVTWRCLPTVTLRKLYLSTMRSLWSRTWLSPKISYSPTPLLPLKHIILADFMHLHCTIWNPKLIYLLIVLNRGLLCSVLNRANNYLSTFKKIKILLDRVTKFTSWYLELGQGVKSQPTSLPKFLLSTPLPPSSILHLACTYSHHPLGGCISQVFQITTARQEMAVSADYTAMCLVTNLLHL